MRRFLFVTAATGVLLFGGSQMVEAQDRSEQRGIFGAGQPGEVSIVRREAKRLGLRNFQMQSRSSNGRLAIDGFSARLGSGTISGTGLVDWSRPNDVQRLTIEFQNVDAASLLRAFEIKLSAQVHALVSGRLDLQWKGVRGSLPRETMQGTLQIQFGAGTVTNADVLNMTASATGIAELQRFDFGSAIIRGTMQGGILRISEANFRGPTQQASGTGVLDMRTEDVRIKWDVSLAPELIARSSRPQIRAAAGAAKKAQGKSGLVQIPLPIAMVGHVRDPQFVVADARATTNSER